MDNTATEIILAALLGVSEALSLIPALKANGILQLFFGIFRFLAGKGQKTGG